MDTKICSRCKVSFPATPEFFFRKKDGKFGFSSFCKICDYKRKKLWAVENKDRVNKKAREARNRRKSEVSKYQQEYRKRVLRETKEIVFNAYGHKCACCGEDRYEFLSVDHIDGSGANHRNKIGKTSSFRTVNVYKDIIKRGFPNTIRILCYNCHLSIDFQGYCPHGILRREYDRGKQAKGVWDVSEQMYQVSKTSSNNT